MASRKTYFGIGWPKDAPDPDSGATNRTDQEDRSAPTVVDDEKVAEGLRQLRSWYQGDTPDANPAQGAPPGSATPLPPGARPTAVGHATAPPAAVVQRPVAPDPMRATMYGHDVHKFDLDATPPTGGAAPPPASSSTALVVADPARQQQAYGQQVEAVPQPVGRSGSDPFPMARGQGEAERLHRPAARASGAYQQIPRASRAQIASRIMFGIGLTALIAAAIFWYQAGGQPETPAAPPPTVSSVQPPSSIPIAPTTAPPPERTAVPAPSPARLGIPANPAPLPVAPISLPKTVQLRLPGQTAPARPVRKRPEPKPVTEPTETAEAPTTVAPPVQDKEPAESKETKARVTDAELKEAKAAKEPKETAAPKEPKEARAATEPKEPKELKETAAPKEPRQAKAPKTRAIDTDATLPPSPSVE